MSFIYYNPNPMRNIVGDCVIRAICKLTRSKWEDVYMDVCLEGLNLYDMPSSNDVWGSYLRKRGYIKRTLPDACPSCYAVRDFCHDFPFGEFLLATGSHVITVINGNYFDTWDSGDEVPVYFWTKGEP